MAVQGPTLYIGLKQNRRSGLWGGEGTSLAPCACFLSRTARGLREYLLGERFGFLLWFLEPDIDGVSEDSYSLNFIGDPFH